jgi:sulfatase maturation enzyme AslB (radical SAM superfamily)
MTYALPESDLCDFSVPDTQVGHVLRRFNVRGIGTPYRSKPLTADPKEIPLHGNVTNPKWAHIIVGGTCNSRCVFCYTEWLRQLPDFTRQQIEDVIDRLARIQTIEKLIFSGGEAKIRHDLERLFAYAGAAGFSDLGLQTNGRELRTRERVEKLAAHGLRRVLLSLHGHTAELHDCITGAKGAFLEVVQALRNLREFRIDVTVNVVVCRDNYQHLNDIVLLASQTLSNRGGLRLSYPIVEGAAFDNVERVLLLFRKSNRDSRKRCS